MFSRLYNLFRGFLGLFISGLERRNPEALLEVEKENLCQQIANFNQGLAAHAGLCEKLMAQVRREEREERELRAKATAALRAGNKELAGEYALRLQSVREELENNRSQLEDAEKTYEELIQARDVSIKAAQTKIQDLKSALTDLKIKRATAEMAEMASGMVSEIGGSGDTLDRLKEMVEEERTLAAGRARVAKDSIDMSGVEVKAAEQRAMADLALADFAAAEGISLDSDESKSDSADDASTKTTTSKSMGPQSE